MNKNKVFLSEREDKIKTIILPKDNKTRTIVL